MSASRLATSASALARFAAHRPSTLTGCRSAPQTAATLLFARHVISRRSSADEETLAKSGEMFSALMASTKGLKSKPASPTDRPSSPFTNSVPSPASPNSKDADAASAPSRDAPTGPTSVTDPANKDILPDMFIPPAKDPLLDYIAAVLQQHGHRARAARQVSRMLLHIHTLTRAPPLPIVRHAIMQAAPAVKVVSFKFGTKILQTPHPLTEKQRVRAAVVAIIEASHRRPGKSMELRLAREMIAVVQGESRTLEEKMRIHKLAMVNRGNMIRS